MTAVPTLDDVRRRALADAQGRTYLEVRRTLRPRWAIVWSHLGLGWAVLALVLAATAALGSGWRWWALPAGVVGGAVAGYVMHFILLFQHEAAHANLAATKRTNDLVANLATGLLVGEDIESYRRVHLDHHRYLGTTRDTERSYFEAPSPRLLVESVTGIRVLRIAKLRAGLQSDAPRPAARRWVRPGALALSVVAVGAPLAAGAPAAALAWAVGLAVVLPFCNTARQILEHRSFDADPSVDYTVTPHGPVTRLFGSGPFASTFGGAGFNRHLLHHWDPGVSYTRLAELERFLCATEAEPAIEAARSTYHSSLLRLLRP